MTRYRYWYFLFLSILPQNTQSSRYTIFTDFTHKITTKLNRKLNISHLFRPTTSISPYDLMASQPVFSVTTSWGSPYLLFERPTDENDAFINPHNLVYESYDTSNDDQFNDDSDDPDEGQPTKKATAQKEPNMNQVALYFCDEEDAMNLRDEFLQNEGMKNFDMRIMATSLTRALRHASHFGNGLPSGRPINEYTGNILAPDEGGSIRYKIVPSKRELFYSSRCRGKQRVGLFKEDDGSLMTNTIPVIGANMLDSRKKMLRSKSHKDAMRQRGNFSDKEKCFDPIQKVYGYMEGQVGIPVFRCPELVKRERRFSIGLGLEFRRHKKHDNTKTLMEKEGLTPLFFSYEDMIEAWKAVHSKLIQSQSKKKGSPITLTMPELPEDVEVYNLMDVVTSIDRKKWWDGRRKKLMFVRHLKGLMNIVFSSSNNHTSYMSNNMNYSNINTNTTTRPKHVSYGLQRVVFIPNRNNVKFKQSMTSLGNGKARLRPMKKWGMDAM